MQPAQSRLSTLLFGKPLTQREQADELTRVGAELDRVLRAVVELLGRETGPSQSYDQAALEWGRIIDSRHDYQGIAARRAMLIFALHILPPVRHHFAKAEPELVADLEKRVLPCVVPAFLSSMAQRPEGLVVMTSTLTGMWKESMGEDGHVAGSGGGVGEEESQAPSASAAGGDAHG